MELTAAQKNQIADQAYRFIENFSVQELIIINHVVVERIKHLQKTEALLDMTNFRLGDTVAFRNGGRLITGRIVKFNQKTISIITDDNCQWNVSPKLLMKKV